MLLCLLLALLFLRENSRQSNTTSQYWKSDVRRGTSFSPDKAARKVNSPGGLDPGEKAGSRSRGDRRGGIKFKKQASWRLNGETSILSPREGGIIEEIVETQRIRG